MPPPTNTRERMRSFLNNIRQNETAPATSAASALHRLGSLDSTLSPAPDDFATRRRATPGSRFLRREQERTAHSRNTMEENTYATLAQLEAAGERLRSVHEEVEELLSRPIVTEALASRGLARADLGRSEDGQASRKRRRIRADDASPRAIYPRPYGYHGQAVPTTLRMQVMSSDGGTMPPFMTPPLTSRRGSMHLGPREYSARNVLRPDKSVYCTSASKCNMVLCHEAETLFNLSKLVIRAPKTGYTHPLQQGLIFVGLQKDELFASTRDYKITNFKESHFGSFVHGKDRPHHRAAQQPSQGTSLATALTPQRAENEQPLADEVHPDCDHDQERANTYDNSEDDSEEEQEESAAIDPTLLQLPQNTDSDPDFSDNEDIRPDHPPRAPTPPIIDTETAFLNAAFGSGIDAETAFLNATLGSGHGTLGSGVGVEDEEDNDVDLDELYQRGTQAQARRNIHHPSTTWQVPPYPEPLPIPQQQAHTTNPATSANAAESHVTTTTSMTSPQSTTSLLTPLAHFHLRANPSSDSRNFASMSRRHQDTRPQPVHVGEFAQSGLHDNYDEPEFVSDYSETPPPPPDPSEPMRIITPRSPPQSLIQRPRKTSQGDGISSTKVTTKLSKDGCSVTMTFNPPVSARYLLIKMWREDPQVNEALVQGYPHDPLVQAFRPQRRMWGSRHDDADQGNIDIERVEAWGTQGRVWCPSETIL